MEDCIFCKIAQGKIPVEKLIETDNFMVIKDVKPQVKGHSLVIPKKHFETFLDLPTLFFNEFMDTTKTATLKLMKDNNSEGFNLVMNNYRVAGQVVPHAHLHILPRTEGDEFKVSVG